MNVLSKSILVVVLSLLVGLLSSGRAEAGHDRWSVTYYGGGGYSPSYSVGYSSGGYIHPDYLRPGRYGYRAYGVYPHPRNYIVPAPWCRTHRLNHYHGYGHGYGHGHGHHDRYDDGDYYRNWGDDRYDRDDRGYGYRDGRGDRYDRYGRRW